MNLVAYPFHDQRKADIEGVRTRDGHLMAEMERSDRVERILIVDRPVSRAERLLRRSSPRARGELVRQHTLGRWHLSLTQTNSKTYILDTAVPDLPDVVLRGRRWWFDVFANPLAEAALEWGVEHACLKNPKAIAWTPTVAPLLGALGSAPFLFDSLDNWLIHPVLRRARADAERAYARLLPRAAAVVASAPASARVLKTWAPVVHVVPNGVDLRRFRAPAPRPPDLPEAPLVGYAGKLAHRIDVELVTAVAMALPHFTFVFIGPMLDRSVRRLARLRNVRFLGDRRPESLPAYVRNFDVCWIPHRVGEGETGGDPIKLYEYWAADRQVVTTPIDGWERWTDRAFVAPAADDAVRVIRGLLEGTIEPRRVWVEPQRTWAAIADELLDLLVTGPTASPAPSGGRS